MKTYKKIDFWVSCLLIAGFAMASCIRHDSSFIIGYFVVGAWHIISMIVHAVNSWFSEKGSVRYYYHWLVIWIFVSAVLGYFFIPILMLVCCIMLFAAPVMAVYYTVLCYDEVYVKMKRPLEFLK